MTRIDNDTDDHLCVAEGHAPEQDIIVAQRNDKLIIRAQKAFISFEKRADLPFGLDTAFELVDQVVWSIEVKRCFEALDTFAWVLERIPEVFGNALILEVCLTIEVLGLYVADALIFRALDHDHISWEKLVLCHFDEVSNLDVSPTNIFKALFRFIVS